MKTRIWAVCAALLVTLANPSVGVSDEDNEDNYERDHDSRRYKRNLLFEVLRASPLNHYRYSVPPGYVPDPFCTSGPAGGAMGIHFVNFSLIGDGVVDAANPEVLLYEPLPGGRIRLVGAEYITFASPPQAVNGHLMNFAAAPNRYGIPNPYVQLHVWAWKRNPNGSFTNWNPDVSCDAYDPAMHPQPLPQL